MKALAVAVEQRDAYSGLKLLDAHADIGGYAVQLVRGFDDAAFLDHGLEHLQVGEIHGRFSGRQFARMRITCSTLFTIREVKSSIECSKPNSRRVEWSPRIAGLSRSAASTGES